MTDNKKSTTKSTADRGYQPSKKTAGHQPNTSGPAKPPKTTTPSIKPIQEQ